MCCAGVCVNVVGGSQRSVKPGESLGRGGLGLRQLLVSGAEPPGHLGGWCWPGSVEAVQRLRHHRTPGSPCYHHHGQRQSHTADQQHEVPGEDGEVAPIQEH